MYNKIRKIFNDAGIYKDVILWFGKEKDLKERTLSDEEIKINAFDKEYRNRFFIPEDIKKYLKELGAGKEWKSLLDSVMDVFIRESHKIYTIRCKEHAHITQSKNKKHCIVHDTINYNEEKAFFRNIPKYNEIVDLTEEKPSIIIDLTIKRNIREKKG